MHYSKLITVKHIKHINVFLCQRIRGETGLFTRCVALFQSRAGWKSTRFVFSTSIVWWFEKHMYDMFYMLFCTVMHALYCNCVFYSWITGSWCWSGAFISMRWFLYGVRTVRKSGAFLCSRSKLWKSITFFMIFMSFLCVTFMSTRYLWDIYMFFVFLWHFYRHWMSVRNLAFVWLKKWRRKWRLRSLRMIKIRRNAQW